MRIAVGGIHIECSTYNPVLTRAEDFRAVRGDELLAAPHFAFLSEYDASFLPTFHARAVPGGPVARETYEAFKADFIARLKQLGPVDGLYLAMHGAMSVEGMEDAEGDWISAARDAVGPDCVVSASYDLHGNLSQRIIDSLDCYSTYRTAPHIDVEETMKRSVAMLVRALKTGERPHVVWAPVPVVLPGEKTSTVDEPAKGLYALLPGIDEQDGIWDASLNVGYVWADEPRATAAAILTGTDRQHLVREAEALAQKYWEARDVFAFGPETGSVADCVAKAVDAQATPVVLADSGDNPTAGGVGDRAELLEALVAANAQDAIVAGVFDADATDAAYRAGIGATLETPVGATLDPKGSTPFSGRFEVVFLADAETDADRQAVLRIGGVSLVVHAKRRAFHNISDFTGLGLDPLGAKIIAVKSGYLSPELAPIAKTSLLILSAGAVDQYIERLACDRRVRPVYPWDKSFAFTAESRAVGASRADQVKAASAQTHCLVNAGAGLADDQSRHSDMGAGRVGCTAPRLDAIEYPGRGDLGEFLDGLNNGRDARLDDVAPRHVVNARQRDIARAVEAKIVDGLQRTERHQIARSDEGGRTVRMRHQAGDMVVGLLGDEIGSDFQLRIDVDVRHGHGGAKTGKPQPCRPPMGLAAEIADPAMPEADQIFGQHGGRELVVGTHIVELDPVDILIDQHDGHVDLPEIGGELRVIGQGRHDDAAHPVAPELIERSDLPVRMRGRVGDNQHVVGFGHDGVDAAQEPAEKRIADITQHQADELVVPSPQTLRHHARLVAELLGRRVNACTRARTDGPLVVEGQ